MLLTIKANMSDLAMYNVDMYAVLFPYQRQCARALRTYQPVHFISPRYLRVYLDAFLVARQLRSTDHSVRSTRHVLPRSVKTQAAHGMSQFFESIADRIMLLARAIASMPSTLYGLNLHIFHLHLVHSL